MKRVLIIVYSAFLLILLINFFYYNSLYKKQINYIIELLDRQVQIVGHSVDNTNNSFISDLNQINFSEDLDLFFSKNNSDNKYRAVERMKLFFSKYQDFVVGIRFYDNNKNEFSLKKDEPPSDVWLEQPFILHVQNEIFSMEKLVEVNRKFEYYLPVYKNNITIGNIVVTVDYQKYFSEIFSAFNLKDYQWQWVVSDSGQIIYNNNTNKIAYSGIDIITRELAGGSVGNLVHNAQINGVTREIISSYYSTQLLQRDLGLVFSAPTYFFQKYIIRNSLFIVLGTLLIVQLIILIFWRFLKSQKSELERLRTSEKMLITLIEKMPVGVIIHNKNREIIKANKVAANQYSFASEAEMKGKIFPETSLPEDNEYFAKHLGGAFNPDQFVIIKKEIGEIILFRSSIPVLFMGEDATLEILIDITMLESARKQEAKANVAKSEFLARMSFEIRTPLNGIIGMADVLNRYDLPVEIKEIVELIRKSTEVLLSIINDILDFSRIESGKMILDEVPFNLREEINYCIDLTKTYISEKDLKIVCSVSSNVPESIIGDPFRLRQILTNLMNHAVRNTEKGEIDLSCVLKSNNGGIITLGFEILDTGRSFDKPGLKKIFGEFINIESKAIKNSDESGFGTILARQLVEIMGGELSAVCPSGISGVMGTKVAFTILAYSNEKPLKSLSLETINTFNKIRTLVITGSQNRDEEILGILHKLGLTITVTTFQKSTINQIKANTNYPEDKYLLVVIFDEEEFDGFEIARVIWENKLSANFIILMISSNDKKGNYMKGVTMGVDHYLVKPTDVNEIMNTLKSSFPNLENLSVSINLDKFRNDINILIVEDNKMNQKVIGAMLKSLGYHFDIADDGYEGYIQAKSKKYNIIFMDLIMPEMDGFEATRKILEYDKTIKIVAFTADNMPDSKRKAELSGITEFIAKPVRIEDLRKLFSRYFNKT